MKHILHQVQLAVLLLGISVSGFAQTLGDTIDVEDGKYKLVSDNLITNPGFSDGFTGWTDATTSAAELTNEKFTVSPLGGVGGSRYLYGTTNEGSSASGSIGTGWKVEAGKKYVFSYYVKYQSKNTTTASEEWLKVSLTNTKTSANEPKVLIDASQVEGGGVWTKNEVVFTNNPPYSYIVARFRWLDSRFGFDSFSLFEVEEVVNTTALETTIDEATALYSAEAQGAADLLTAIQAAEALLNGGSIAEVKQGVEDLEDAMYAFKLANATEDAPLDMTDYIVNPDFVDNDNTGWDGVGVVNYSAVEFYEKTFDMHQAISGLPAGKYRLKAQGYERPKSNDVGAAYKAGTETIYARLYAKADSYAEQLDTFPSLYEVKYTGSGSSGGYINTMSGAQTVMGNSESNFAMQVEDILLGEGDELVIGARTTFKQTGYWALFDNFRLEYLGAADNDDLANDLADQLVVAKALLDDTMQVSARENLLTNITVVEDVLGAVSVETSTLQQAASDIKSAIETAEKSIAAYVTLKAAIKAAEVDLGRITGTRYTKLLNAVATGNSLKDNLEASLGALQTAAANINSIIEKKIHVPTWLLGDVTDPDNTYSYERSLQSKNWIIFWEAGYGSDPSVLTDGEYRVDVQGILDQAEEFYQYHIDSLKFTTWDGNYSSQYKMIIRLRYTSDWDASGSGVDNMIGLLTLSAWSAQVAGHTLAHEVGHCFQYQTHCDNGDSNGWMYGFDSDPNDGVFNNGNGWWEQCAQWQANKIFPSQYFSSSYYSAYLDNAHKHLLHETPRYSNYFIQDFWTYKHGLGFIAKLWNESKSPEDPIETYKRLNAVSQSQFNDEMLECASRFATWDIPTLRSLGASKFASRAQTSMVSQDDDYWLISSSNCLENYGYNLIKLNARSNERVSVYFQGEAGMDGYRKKNISMAGWRFGFVALQSNGTRVYSDIGRASYLSPTDTLHFDTPENTIRLWLVVTGAPSSHWLHEWDDDDTDDEQWPYQVKFNQTNLYGRANVISSVPSVHSSNIELYTAGSDLVINQLPGNSIVSVYDITGRAVWQQQVNSSSLRKTFSRGIYIVKIQTGNEIYSEKIRIQ